MRSPKNGTSDVSVLVRAAPCGEDACRRLLTAAGETAQEAPESGAARGTRRVFLVISVGAVMALAEPPIPQSACGLIEEARRARIVITDGNKGADESLDGSCEQARGRYAEALDAAEALDDTREIEAVRDALRT